MEKFDVIIVGAGPAGITSALALARSGFKVAIIERGEEPGSKNMSGAVLYYTEALDKLLPNYWEEAPVERCITKHIITLLTPDSSFSLNYENPGFNKAPFNGFSVLRSKFDRWYAQKAEEAGALLINSTVVDDLIWDNNKVVGVQTRRDQGILKADAVIAADGANSLLAKKAGLRKEFKTGHFSSATKEVLTLPPEIIEERFNLEGNEGVSHTFIGSATNGVEGGAFLYTNKSGLSIGIVAKLNSLEKQKVSIAELQDSFKSHPAIAKLLKGADLKEYSGHLIPEGGITAIPKLYDNGILVVGDAAGLLCSTGLTLQGMNYAITSGYAAAETLIRAKQMGAYCRENLAYYKTLLNNSSVLKDLKLFHRMPELLTNPDIYELYPEIICGILDRRYRADGKAKKRMLDLVKLEIKGKISRWRILKDVINAGRALIW